ncbi:hypothetical protein GCM10009066_09240 [Halarchaeum salinum]|uniref:Uncharacterized protein n=1 Tax=Halarchaeum salinum TaxID=489912 RepID=A0AAV3S6F8_9EURY
MSQQTCAFCDADPDVRLGQAGSWGKDELITHTRSAWSARSVNTQTRPSNIASRAMAVAASSTPSPPSPAIASNSPTSKVRSTSALAAVPPDRQPTGLATSEHTSFEKLM